MQEKKKVQTCVIDVKTENQSINWQSFVNTPQVTLFSLHMRQICSVHSVFKPVGDWLILETC